MSEYEKFKDRAEFDAFLIEWDEKKKKIEVLKEEEMEMRKRIAYSGFTTQESGVNTAELGNGYKLKTTINLDYKLDPDKHKVLSAIEKLPEFLQDRIVRWKVELSVTEYKQLDPAHKKIIDRVLTIEHGAPKVEIKSPKGKK